MTEDFEVKIEKTKYAKYNMEENRDFIPYKIAVRLKQSIRFSVLLDLRSTEVNDGQNYDQNTLKMLDHYDDHCKHHGHFIPFQEWDHDYESYPILRNHKIKSLESMIKFFIDRKYKISLAKGMMLVMEQAVLLVSLLSMILKANVFSFVYLIFIMKFFRCETKVHLLVRMNYYIAFLLAGQYFMMLINLTSSTSPQPFPYLMDNYPHMYENEDPTIIPFAIPFFYHYKPFRDLNLCYFLGIGVS